MSKIFRNNVAGKQFNVRGKKLQSSEFKSFFEQAYLLRKRCAIPKVTKSRIAKKKHNKRSSNKELVEAEQTNEVKDSILPVKCNTLSDLGSALEAVKMQKCVLINFNQDIYVTDSQAWYDETRKVSHVISLNMRANGKLFMDALMEAANGKGEYANSTVVITTDSRCKKPKEVFNINVTDADAESKRKELQDFIDYNGIAAELSEYFDKELNFDLISAYRKEKILGDIQVNLEGVLLDYFEQEALKTIEKEDGKLKLAAKRRHHMYQRRRIYNTACGFFQSYTMKKDPSDTNWFFIEETQRPAISELLRAIIEEYNLGYVETNNLVKSYSFNTILQVNFQGEFDQAKDFKRIFRAPDGKLYVHTKCAEIEGDDELEYSDKVFKEYRCLTSYDTIKELPEGTETFINIAHGASGVRKNASFYLLDDGKIERILDKASRGMYLRFKGRKLQNSDIVKANTRILASTAPSQILYNIDCFAIYVEKFGIGDKDSRIEKFKGLKKTLDGIAYSLFNAMQARLGSSKIFASQITHRLMQMIIRFLDANPIVLEIGAEETEEQKAIMQAAFSKDQTVMINGELVDLAGRVIICRKEGSNAIVPEYLSDLNGFKANFDLTKGFEIPVLDMPIANNAHSSTQFLSKLIAAGGQKAIDLITTRMKAHFDSLLEGLTKDAEVSMKDVKDPFIKGLIGKACPEYMKLDISVRRQTAGLLLNSIAKSLNRMRFPIVESANGRAIPDIGALFGMPILQDDEVYTVDIKAGTELIIIKYPTIGEKEFWKARRVSYKEICARIDALETPESLKGFGNDFKQELKNYFRMMEPGCAVMPADKAIMAGLAGMDYDYDMVIMIYDKEFVAIFKDTKPGVIHIMNDEAAETLAVEFNYTVMSDPQLELISKTAANVGGVTNNYNIPIQFDLLCRSYQSKGDTLRKMLEKATKEDNAAEIERLTKEIEKQDYKTNMFIERFAMLIEYSLLSPGKARDVLKKRKKTIMEKYEFEGDAPDVRKIQKDLEKLNARTTGPAYEPIGENNDNPIYTYLPVSKEQKQHAEKQLFNCRIATIEDVRLICADINRIARSDQETTIDSAKTSIVANIVLNFSTFFNVFSKIEYEYEVNRDTNRIVRYVKRPNGDRGDLGKKFYIYDLFAIIRDEVEQYIVPKVQDFIDNYSYSDEKILELLPNYKGTTNLAACLESASFYGILALNNATGEDKMAKSDTNNYYKAIHHMVKFAVKDDIISETANGFGRFAAWLSFFGNGQDGKVQLRATKTGFNLSCFPIETLYFAYKLTKKLARVCEPVTCIESAIEEDEFLEFVNGDAYNEDGRLVAVAKEFLNGTFKMARVNDKLMACDKISNYLSKDQYDKNYVAFSVKGAHKDLSGAITFDAAARGARTSRGNAKVVIDGNIYDSHMYEALKLIKSMGKELYVAHSHIIVKDNIETTVVLAKIGDAAVMIEDDVVPGYAYDESFGYTDEEEAAIMDFNPMDYGFEYSDYTEPNFDEMDESEILF